MRKDIDDIKKVLIAVAKDLEALDARLRAIECGLKTIDIALDEKKEVVIYNVGMESNNFITDEIDELFSLIEDIKCL
jgi:hypothetical protein